MRLLVNWIDDSGQDISGGTMSIEESPFTGGTPAEGDSVAMVSAHDQYASGIWVLGDVSNPAAVPITRRADMAASSVVYTGETVVANINKDSSSSHVLLLYATNGAPQPSAVVGVDYFNFISMAAVNLG